MFEEEVVHLLPQRIVGGKAEFVADMEQDGFDGVCAKPSRDFRGGWKFGAAFVRREFGAGGARLVGAQCIGGGMRRVQTGGGSSEPFFQCGGKPQASGNAGEHERGAFGAEAHGEEDERLASGALLRGGGELLAEVDEFVEEAEQAGGTGGCPVLVRIRGWDWLGEVGRGGHGESMSIMLV